MKDYTYTRKEVERLVNTKILPSLRKKYHGTDVEKRIAMIMFFYSVERMASIECLLRLALIDMTGKDDYPELEKYFVEV